MPVIGDVSRFATEYELSAKPLDEWMWGRFCYWCGGVQVGDFADETTLRDVLTDVVAFRASV